MSPARQRWVYLLVFRIWTIHGSIAKQILRNTQRRRRGIIEPRVEHRKRSVRGPHRARFFLVARDGVVVGAEPWEHTRKTFFSALPKAGAQLAIFERSALKETDTLFSKMA